MLAQNGGHRRHEEQSIRSVVASIPSGCLRRWATRRVEHRFGSQDGLGRLFVRGEKPPFFCCQLIDNELAEVIGQQPRLLLRRTGCLASHRMTKIRYGNSRIVVWPSILATGVM